MRSSNLEMRITHWSALKRKQNVQTKLTAFMALLAVLLDQKKKYLSSKLYKGLVRRILKFFRASMVAAP